MSETRIGDQERAAAMEALGEHLRAGRLDPHEYSERVETVGTARTMTDLEPLFADLPAPAPVRPPTGVPGAGGATGVDLSKAAPAGPRPFGPFGSSGPLGGRAGATLVSASPFLAVILFFATHDQWLWFLLVPLSSAVVYGGRGWAGHRGRDRQRDRHHGHDLHPGHDHHHR